MLKYFLILITFTLLTTTSYSQYRPGKQTFGILVGDSGGGFDGSGALPIMLEYNITNLDQKVQFGIVAAYAHTSEDYVYTGWGSGTWSRTYFILAAEANYHFLMQQKFDPFLGLSIGYNHGSTSWGWTRIDKSGTVIEPSAASTGGLFWSAQAGMNYWFNEKWAVQARIGYVPYFGVGITYAP
jgi:hypothetical protein